MQLSGVQCTHAVLTVQLICRTFSSSQTETLSLFSTRSALPAAAPGPRRPLSVPGLCLPRALCEWITQSLSSVACWPHRACGPWGLWLQSVSVLPSCLRLSDIPLLAGTARGLRTLGPLPCSGCCELGHAGVCLSPCFQFFPVYTQTRNWWIVRWSRF